MAGAVKYFSLLLMGLAIYTCARCKTVVHKDSKHEKFVEKMKESHMKDGEHNAEFDRDMLFAEEDDEDVDLLTAEEKKEKLKSLIEKKIDADKDGYVSLDELVAWTLRSLDLYETEEARLQFADIDTNKDGTAQWEEYASDTYGKDFDESDADFKVPPSTEWEEFVTDYKKDKKKFYASDLDDSGNLDKEEFVIFRHPRLHEKTRQIVVNETLESSDLNGDGAIDIDEFLGDYQKDAEEGDPEWAIFEKDKFSNELDTNKDGQLTGEEIVLWITPDNDILAHEEAEHLMKESDTDNDDRLTLEEIIENYAEWVDSEATDYGQQLLENHDEL